MLFIHAWPSAIHLFLKCGCISPFSEEHLQEFEAAHSQSAKKLHAIPSRNPLMQSLATLAPPVLPQLDLPPCMLRCLPRDRKTSGRQSQTGNRRNREKEKANTENMRKHERYF
jgi:hypothetical protein